MGATIPPIDVADGVAKEPEATTVLVAVVDGPGRPFSGGADGRRWANIPADKRPPQNFKDIIEFRKACREQTYDSLMTLIEIRDNAKSDKERRLASEALLDRAWGRPSTVIAAEPIEDGAKRDTSLLDVFQRLAGIADAASPPAPAATPAPAVPVAEPESNGTNGHVPEDVRERIRRALAPK